jgi:hypothetical protein
VQQQHRQPQQQPPQLPKRLYPELSDLTYPSITTPLATTLNIVDNNNWTPATAESESDDDDREQIDEEVRQKYIQKEQNMSAYGPAGSREASVKWFKATQARSLRQKNGAYMEWFHGIISRKEAERLLSDKPVGSFLVRVGETTVGFTLSFKDANRCRHYMIAYLPSDAYVIVGENVTHSSLSDLVEYHKQHRLTNWDKLLTEPCSQAEGECDYTELIVSHKEENELLEYVFNKPRKEASAPLLCGMDPSEFQSPPVGQVEHMAGMTAHVSHSPPLPHRSFTTTEQPDAVTAQLSQTVFLPPPRSSATPEPAPRLTSQVSQGPPLPHRLYAPNAPATVLVSQASQVPSLPLRSSSSSTPAPAASAARLATTEVSQPLPLLGRSAPATVTSSRGAVVSAQARPPPLPERRHAQQGPPLPPRLQH